MKLLLDRDGHCADIEKWPNCAMGLTRHKKINLTPSMTTWWHRRPVQHDTCGLLCRPCMVIRTTNRKEYFVIFLVLKWLKIKSLVKLCVRSLWIFLFFIYFFTFENWHWKECMVNFEFLAHTQVTHRHSIFFFSWFHDFRMSFHHLFRLSLQFSGSFFVISSRFLVNTIHHTK